MLTICTFSVLTVTGQSTALLCPGEGRLPPPSFTQFSVALSVGFKSQELYPHNFSMFFVFLLVLIMFGWSRWWDFIGGASYIGHTVTQQKPWSVSYVFSALSSAMFPEYHVPECFADAHIGSRLHISWLCLSVVISVRWKKEVFLKKDEDEICLWVYGEI